MPLTAPQIEEARYDLTRNSRACPGPVTKPDMAAAVDYTATFLESKQAEWIAGLPEPFKSSSNAAQKAALFLHAAAALAGRRL